MFRFQFTFRPKAGRFTQIIKNELDIIYAWSYGGLARTTKRYVVTSGDPINASSYLPITFHIHWFLYDLDRAVNINDQVINMCVHLCNRIYRISRGSLKPSVASVRWILPQCLMHRVRVAQRAPILVTHRPSSPVYQCWSPPSDSYHRHSVVHTDT